MLICLSLCHLLLTISALNTTEYEASNITFPFNTTDIDEILNQSLFTIVSAPTNKCPPGHQLDQKKKCRKVAEANTVN